MISPLLVNMFMIFSFIVFIQEDSIMFNISHNRDEQALKLINKVYDTEIEADFVILTELKF
jgi:uncharacterized BrkB/YihY/UPF0761 family membrane protein